MARKLSLIALILVALYSLAGFVVLPWYLERTIPDRMARHLGWDATIESVQVNPFAMSIEASGLGAQDGDGERVLAFSRLYVNLGVLRLATGTVALQNFELDEPFARLDLLEDYSVNVARDWQANNPAAEPQSEAESGAESSDSIRLFLDRFRIAGGEVLFRDFSQGGSKEFQISPLDLALNDLATWPREDSESDYYLLAAIGSQTIEWEGDLSIAPLYSTGFLSIADVSHTTLSHFLTPYLPYTLLDGSLTLTSNYELSSGEQFSLSTSDGEVTLTDVALAMAGDVAGDIVGNGDAELLRSGRIRIPAIDFGLINREVSIGTVEVDDIRLGLERDEKGVLNLLRPFVAGDSGGEDSAEDSAEGAESGGGSSPDPAPFRWSVAGLELEDGRVDWLDNQPANAVDLTLEQVTLSVGRLSQALAEPVNYEAAMALAAGGRFNVRGQTTLQPFTLEAGLSVADLALAQFDSYLGDMTNLTLRDGLLSLDGNLDLDNLQAPLTGTFSGNGQISALDMRLADSDSPLIAWQNLRLEPLEYNLSPARLEIGTLTLSDPNINVIREQGGLHNLARILPSNEGSEAPDTGTDDEPPGFIFRVNQLLLEEGDISYTDQTVEPVFSTSLDQLNGSVTGISNVAPQQGKVSVQGRLGDVGSVKFDGAIGALGTEDVSNLNLQVDGVALPALSPYLGRYLGYGVRNGKLNLNLDYEIAGSRIDAANQIVLDSIELGDVVASELAVNAPLKLGLALLRDRRGVIDINLPIQGDLADPQFSVGPIVMRTFVNLIARAATSPFSMLGSLADMAGLTGEELGYVSFVPGRVAMMAGSEDKLEALSQALDKRPSLLLKLRGAVSPEVDGESLRRQLLVEQLGISEQPSVTDRIAQLESRYQAAGFEQTLVAFRQEIVGEDDDPERPEWEQALVNRLVSRVELPQEALAGLARARGVRLKAMLQDDFDVSNDQLFLLEPIQEAAQGDGGSIKVNFELDAR